MPIYEYACGKCQHQFEALVRGSEQTACPACGSAQLEKQWSVPAAHSRSASNALPVCQPSSHGGCGLPQCGGGQCGM